MRRNKKDYLIVDGYNIINSWDEIKELSKTDLEHAREKLIDAIIEYAEYISIDNEELENLLSQYFEVEE